jgi:hypothetical protein
LRSLRVSLWAQAALALYFQAVQWLPLGRWNYQPGDSSLSPFNNVPLAILASAGRLTLGQALLVVAFVVPFACFVLAYRLRSRRFMWLQVGFYVSWLAIETSWWVLYAVGRDQAGVLRYQQAFGPSTQLLPSVGNHLPPDGAHTVLYVLLVTVVCSGFLGLKNLAPATQEGSGGGPVVAP